MIALVNPVSSGVELARAFHERGARCLHCPRPEDALCALHELEDAGRFCELAPQTP